MGCINPQLFSPRGGRLIDAHDLIEAALSARDEGLTVLGGEPFDQAEEIAVLAEAAQRAGLGVIVFSGYEKNALEQRADARLLLAAVDLLVDGPYLMDQPEGERALVGSRNQQFHHLTTRYSGFDPAGRSNSVDVRLLPDGSIEVGGFLDSDGARQFKELLEVRPVKRR